MGLFVDKPCWGTEELIGKRVYALPSKGFKKFTNDIECSPDKCHLVGVVEPMVHFTQSTPIYSSAVILMDNGKLAAVSKDLKLVTEEDAKNPIFYVSSSGGVSFIRFNTLQGIPFTYRRYYNYFQAATDAQNYNRLLQVEPRSEFLRLFKLKDQFDVINHFLPVYDARFGKPEPERRGFLDFIHDVFSPRKKRRSI